LPGHLGAGGFVAPPPPSTDRGVQARTIRPCGIDIGEAWQFQN
jgi:hypothetical protein